MTEIITFKVQRKLALSFLNPEKLFAPSIFSQQYVIFLAIVLNHSLPSCFFLSLNVCNGQFYKMLFTQDNWILWPNMTNIFREDSTLL